MSGKKNLRVLVAPLDWGLGHTTRCVPIINHLLSINCTVIIGCEGSAKELLQQEFPQLHFLHLEGYRVKYSKNKRLLQIKILCQLPKLWKTIKKEQKWLHKIVLEHSINAVISDNRYGLWHAKTPTIFITHQLQIKGPNKWIERLLRVANYHHINRFTACWIPDFYSKPTLAGELSHPPVLPAVPVHYLGGLSRFTLHISKKFYDVLVVISGPEPQRSLLEQKMLNELKNFKGKALLVRGLPGVAAHIQSFNQVTIKNHLNAAALETAFNETNLVISRAGYTTVMDLVKLKKKSILIPTPGQTEQEYLAAHLQQQGIAITFSQDEFVLEKALELAGRFTYTIPIVEMDAYKKVIDEFIASLRS